MPDTKVNARPTVVSSVVMGSVIVGPVIVSLTIIPWAAVAMPFFMRVSVMTMPVADITIAAAAVSAVNAVYQITVMCSLAV